MKIRLYLETADVDNEFVQRAVSHFDDLLGRPRTAGNSEDFTVIAGMFFHCDQEGVYVDADRFQEGIPRRFIDKKLPIRLVVLCDEGVKWRPQPGMYECGQVCAVIDNFVRTKRSGNSFSREVDEFAWRIHITGGTLAEVARAYRCFRRGELELTEPWEPLRREQQPTATPSLPSSPIDKLIIGAFRRYMLWRGVS